MAMAKWVKVREDFDLENFDGALVVFGSLADGMYFNEHGWDDGDMEAMKVICVEIAPTNPADDEALQKVLSELGIKPNDGDAANDLPDVICKRPDVRAALDAAGFDCVRTENLVIHNTVNSATIVWNPQTFRLLADVGHNNPVSVEFGAGGDIALTLNSADKAWQIIRSQYEGNPLELTLESILDDVMPMEFSFPTADEVDAQQPTLVIAENVARDAEGKYLGADRAWGLGGTDLSACVDILLARGTVMIPQVDFTPARGLTVH